jgi:hypothetical protein
MPRAKHSTVIAAKITPALRRRLEQAAAREERTVSWFVRRLIEQALQGAK